MCRDEQKPNRTDISKLELRALVDGPLFVKVFFCYCCVTHQYRSEYKNMPANAIRFITWIRDDENA